MLHESSRYSLFSVLPLFLEKSKMRSHPSEVSSIKRHVSTYIISRQWREEFSSLLRKEQLIVRLTGSHLSARITFNDICARSSVTISQYIFTMIITINYLRVFLL